MSDDRLTIARVETGGMKTPEYTPRPGDCNCLRCGKRFRSPDRRRQRTCYRCAKSVTDSGRSHEAVNMTMRTDRRSKGTQ